MPGFQLGTGAQLICDATADGTPWTSVWSTWTPVVSASVTLAAICVVSGAGVAWTLVV